MERPLLSKSRANSSSNHYESERSRDARSRRKSTQSYVTRSSSQGGTAWSGTGPALTERNLATFNRAKAQSRSATNVRGIEDQIEAGNEEEVARSTRRTSRAQEVDIEDTTRASRRQSRQSSGTQGGSSRLVKDRRTTVVDDAAEEEAETISSPSRHRSKTVDVIDIDITRSAGQTRGSRAQSTTKSVSRKDSASPENTQVKLTVQEDAAEGVEASTVSESQVAESTANTTKTDATTTQYDGWERTTKIRTIVWPDGRTEREKEVRMVRAVAA